jgi:hypothetical protein
LKALETVKATESTALAIARATERINNNNLSNLNTNIRINNLEKSLKRQEQWQNEFFNNNKKQKFQKTSHGSHPTEQRASPEVSALTNQNETRVDLTLDQSQEEIETQDTTECQMNHSQRVGRHQKHTQNMRSKTSQENDNTLERSGNKKLQPTCSSRHLPFQNHSKQHDKRRKDASNSNSPLTIPSVTTTKWHSHTNTITHSNERPRTEQTLQSQHYGQRRTISTKYSHLQPLPATSQFTRESTQKESLRQQAPPPKLQRKHQEEEHKGTLNGVTTTKMLNKMNTSSEKFTVPNDTA